MYEESNTTEVIHKNDLLNWQIISKNRNLLFGVAIIWVMLRHSMEYPGIKKWIGFQKSKYLAETFNLVNMGGIGVDIFLFLSGIGLYYSFSKNSNIKEFYIKRLKRVLIPYLILGGAYLIIRDVISQGDMVSFFKDISWITYYTEGLTTHWYINFILLMYLIYPVIYYLLENKYRNLFFVLLLACSFSIIYVMYNYNLELFQNIDKSVTRIPIFIIGCYWGKFVKLKKPITDFWIIYALVVPLVGGIFQYIGYLDLFPWKVSSRIWYGMMAISLCILFSLLLSVTELKHLKKLLNLAGTLSLELYLTHIAMKGILKRICSDYAEWSMAKSCLLYFIGVIVVSFVISIVYHSISNKLGQIKKKKEL
jgi:peptidoglycan/LPS O-acetylase OafA/YrhL